MNKVFLIGNLTKDIELKSVGQDNISVCKFSIAVNRRFADKDGNKTVDFFNIVAWRGLAENCAKFLSKGKKIAVFGELQTRSYDDKDGVKRTAIEVLADEIEFLTPKSADEQASKQQDDNDDLSPVTGDNLPF